MDIFPIEVQRHDFFNIIVLGVIGVLDILYLYNSTDFNFVGTAHMGSDSYSREIYSYISAIFLTYIIIDIFWIILVPKSVMVKPYEVILHHFATFLLAMIPVYVHQFQWHAALSISVEIQTLILANRRRYPKHSQTYKTLDTFFYIAWFFYRLLLFPFLTIFFFFEYQRYTQIVETGWNVLIIASPLFALLTLQGFVWTYSVLTKSLNMEGKKKENLKS